MHPEDVRHGVGFGGGLQLGPVLVPAGDLHLDGHVGMLCGVSVADRFHARALGHVPDLEGQVRLAVGRAAPGERQQQRQHQGRRCHTGDSFHNSTPFLIFRPVRSEKPAVGTFITIICDDSLCKCCVVCKIFGRFRKRVFAAGRQAFLYIFSQFQRFLRIFLVGFIQIIQKSGESGAVAGRFPEGVLQPSLSPKNVQTGWFCPLCGESWMRRARHLTGVAMPAPRQGIGARGVR